MRQSILRVSLLGLLSLCSCATVDTGAADSTTVDEPSESSTLSPGTQPSTKPLDDIPGLGVSESAALRDDMIAYYEAWQRDMLVAHCMAQAGQTWLPEVLYPPEVVVEIAQSLGVEPAADFEAKGPDEVNRESLLRLEGESLEDYWQALYAESAADIAYWQSHDGAAPPDADPDTFATDGCSEVGWNAIPGIWDFKSELADGLEDLRTRARTTEAFLEGQSRYKECIAAFGFDDVESPGELDKFVLAHEGEQDESLEDNYAEAGTECSRTWADAVDAGMREAQDEFRSENADAIAQQQAHYESLANELREDQEFLEFVSEACARAATA